MEAFLSLEDRSAVQRAEYSGYRRRLADFLQDQLGESIPVRRGDGEIGWTSFPENPGGKVRLARDSRSEVVLDPERWRKTNTSSPIFSPWISDPPLPVLVMDSDGVEPEYILDYIEEVHGGGRKMKGDSVYLGHVVRWLSLFSEPEPAYHGRFGVIIQHPNLEAGSFSGYVPDMGENMIERGAKHTQLAFIEKAGERMNPYWRSSSSRSSSKRIDTNKVVNIDFLDRNDIQLFSDLVDSQSLFLQEPDEWVRHVLTIRGQATEMKSACYLSKKVRGSRATSRRDMQSTWSSVELAPERIALHFRLFG